MRFIILLSGSRNAESSESYNQGKGGMKKNIQTTVNRESLEKAIDTLWNKQEQKKLLVHSIIKGLAGEKIIWFIAVLSCFGLFGFFLNKYVPLIFLLLILYFSSTTYRQFKRNDEELPEAKELSEIMNKKEK